MTDLTEFLLARIAEDEAAAKAATGGPWSLDLGGVEDEVRSDANGWPVATSRRWRDGAWDFTFENPEDADHIARWDPARVLAECDAKRRIVEEWQSRNTTGGWYELACLALPYADHPDYRQEWSR